MAPDGNARNIENRLKKLEDDIAVVKSSVLNLQSTTIILTEATKLLSKMNNVLSNESNDNKSDFLKLLELNSQAIDALHAMVVSDHGLIVDHLKAHKEAIEDYERWKRWR